MNKWFILVIAIVCGLAGCRSGPALRDVGSRADSISSYIKHKSDSLMKDDGQIPGLLIALRERGHTYYYTTGFADPDRKKVFDSLTVFEVGSVTKTFTAYVLEAVLLQRNISDTSRIINFLPDSVKANQHLAGITFLQLMNHTSGLPRLPDNMDLFSDFTHPYDNYSEELMLSFLKQFKGGKSGSYNYSNLAAGLAGWLAGRIAGKTYTELLEENIFSAFLLGKQLNASDTNKAQGYFEGNKTDFWGMNVLGPAYVVKSSPDQLLNYLNAMAMAKDSVASKVINKMLEPSIYLSPKSNVCRGWHTIESKNRPTIYWHNGATYGFSCFAAFVRDTDKAVVVVANYFNKNAVTDALGIKAIQLLSD